MENKVESTSILPRVDDSTLNSAVSTTQHIDQFRTQYDPRPLPSTIFSGALLDGIFPKIAETLQGTDTGLKIQALRETNELLHRSVNIVHVDKHGVFAALRKTLFDEDTTVRKSSSQALLQFAKSRYGREAIVKADLREDLAKAVSDAEPVVRSNCVQLLRELCLMPKDMTTILAAGIFRAIVKQCAEEQVDSVKVDILELIAKCIRHESALSMCLSAGLVTSLVNTLKTTKNTAIQASACKVLGLLSVPPDGKNTCVHEGAVPVVLPLLESEDAAVRTTASLALMNFAIALSGKVAIIQAGGVPKLIERVNDTMPAVISHSLQAVASVAEHPEAKRTASALLKNPETIAKLQQVITKFSTQGEAKETTGSTDETPTSSTGVGVLLDGKGYAMTPSVKELVVRGARCALEIIQWVP